MTKLVVCTLLTASLAVAQQYRGETPVHRQSSTLTVQGMLFDAGCKDRSSLNLSSSPETLAGAMPVETSAEKQAAGKARNSGGAVSSHGISVDAKTVAAERADVVQHQVPDLVTRQADPSCAITGGTFGYAVLLDDGRILNLDEGGNTLAGDAILANKEGRAMLNGAAYGFKPRVKITGRIRGDRLMVDQIFTQ